MLSHLAIERLLELPQRFHVVGAGDEPDVGKPGGPDPLLHFLERHGPGHGQVPDLAPSQLEVVPLGTFPFLGHACPPCHRGDHRLDGPVQNLPDRLGPVRADVDADLSHDLRGHRMDLPGGLETDAGNLEKVPRGRTQRALGHLTATRMARAKDQSQGFHAVSVGT